MVGLFMCVAFMGSMYTVYGCIVETERRVNALLKESRRPLLSKK
jgi:hypothetical protein